MADVVAKDRKILVAVDEGEESMYALSWCLKNIISQCCKDTLFLLYVRSAQAFHSSLDGTGYLFSSDVLATVDKYSNDVKVEVIIESGDPRDVICRVAENINADVLVMGSHGYGLIQ
ncbi:hypothetical protein Godav_028322, partial [Gossypium davidsonii]|nr:hypothetical protein [Gossypium davidsonii]